MLFARSLAAMVAVALLAMPAAAKNFAVPDKNPAITITVPDDWKSEEIAYGYSARPKDEAIFFSVEFADARNVEKMLDNNEAWMKENKIKKVAPIKADAPLNGIPATIFQFRTSDENGPTVVDFIMMSAGNNRMIMLTVWGSNEERETHAKALDAIFGSIKAIN
ncbi:hypothetical protein DWF00_11575 [Bosea caraganae]|uniref:DUF1795 domain-containing protein n=1 Tax=Bosea caraganae TaxID=2763117 RepID=A0A370LC93_9HYPH|nr:hypothetical protein [Bosea caraganae]RDJ27572.1 hypothetical protein DWF00_11575 [Bosea caraganae]RDJ29587.1 hypothetical protein DWE98_03345 [Bosea caraganae]